MIGKRIPQLPAAPTINADDLLVIEQDGRTKRTTAGELVGDFVIPVITDFVEGIVEEQAQDGRYQLDATGSVQRTIKDRLEDYVSVKDFGAVGDGVTNDTAAIQAGIDAMEAAGGARLHFPAGTYLCSTLWIDDDNIHLYGDGVGRTIIKAIAGQVVLAAGILKGGFVTPVAIQNVSLRGIEFDGSRLLADGTGGNVGVAIYQVTRLLIEDCYVHDCDGYGIGLLGSNQPNRKNATIRDVEIGNVAYDGLDIKSGFDTALLDNVYAHDCGGGSDMARDRVGIDIRGSNITVRKCRADNVDTDGIRVRENAGSPIFISDCIASGATQDGFSFAAAATFNTFVSNCYSYDNDRYGFRVDGGIVDLVNCTARGNINGLTTTAPIPDTIITITNGDYSGNDSDGIRLNSVSMERPVRLAGVLMDGNGRNGIRAEGPFIMNNCIVTNNTGPGVIVQSTNPFWNISGSRLTDTRAVGKTQTHGIQFAAGSASGVMLGNDMTGNLTADMTGTPATGSLFFQRDGTTPLRFGTHAVKGAETLTGFITITDAAGTSRKVGVIS